LHPPSKRKRGRLFGLLDLRFRTLPFIPLLVLRTCAYPFLVLLTLNGQHVCGLFDAVLEARIESGVLEDNVRDVKRCLKVDVEPIVIGEFHVPVAGWRDRQTTQPDDAIALGTQ